MLVRHADPDRDAGACARIYAPSVTAGVASFEADAPDAEAMGVRIAQTSERYPWLVAELDGTVGGYAYGSPFRTRPAYGWSAEVTVYVDAAHHRRGVGRALYVPLLALLARQGIHEACAGITLPNDASVALHEALGFTQTGLDRRIGFKHGRWWDVGRWQRTLRPHDGPPTALGPPARLPDSVQNPDQ